MGKHTYVIGILEISQADFVDVDTMICATPLLLGHKSGKVLHFVEPDSQKVTLLGVILCMNKLQHCSQCCKL